MGFAIRGSSPFAAYSQTSFERETSIIRKFGDQPPLMLYASEQPSSPQTPQPRHRTPLLIAIVICVVAAICLMRPADPATEPGYLSATPSQQSRLIINCHIHHSRSKEQPSSSSDTTVCSQQGQGGRQHITIWQHTKQSSTASSSSSGGSSRGSFSAPVQAHIRGRYDLAYDLAYGDADADTVYGHHRRIKHRKALRLAAA